MGLFDVFVNAARRGDFGPPLPPGERVYATGSPDVTVGGNVGEWARGLPTPSAGLSLALSERDVPWLWDAELGELVPPSSPRGRSLSASSSPSWLPWALGLGVLLLVSK